MPITYPLPFPDAVLGVSSIVHVPDRVQLESRARGGAVQAVDRGRTLWRLEITTTFTTFDEYREVSGWLDALGGMVGSFTFADPVARRPRAYPGEGWAGITRHAGGAFDGTASVTDVTGRAVTIGSLPSAYPAKRGDLMSWAWGATRTLHRVLADATASAGVVTVDVEPIPPPLPGGGSYPRTVKLEAPDAVYGLTGEPVLPAFETVIGKPIRITALQRLHT